MHFEELWEACEEQNKRAPKSSSNIVDEIIIKIGLYKRMVEDRNIPGEDKRKAKVRILGEVLHSITNLSLIDEINVFDALAQAYSFYANQK
jgi:hypothetical protein